MKESEEKGKDRNKMELKGGKGQKVRWIKDKRRAR